MKLKASSRVGFLALAIIATVSRETAMGRVHKPRQTQNDLNDPPSSDYTNTTIVGGEESGQNEFPYFVDLGKCGGSLIAPRVVLTAAHCSPVSFENLEVTVGAHKREEDKRNRNKRIKVIEGIAHPFFGRSEKNALSNDYGLLLLERAYNIQSNIKLVVNKDHNKPRNGQMLKAIGMGTTKFLGPMADTLRDVSVPAINKKECRESYGDTLTRKMMCAGEKGSGKDSCQGDSGSPLIRRNGHTHLLVGITSWGIDCGKYPGVYAKASRGMKWIQSQVCDKWKAGTSELCDVRVADDEDMESDTQFETACIDDPDFAHRGIPEKDCSWVKEQPKFRCKLKNGKRRARDYCQKSCGRCEIELI